MNLINPGGLLWFDDDARRPISQKIAEAVQRYRERVGYEPTVCQLNPAQATALEASVNQTTTRTKRSTGTPAPTLPATLRLVPSDLIQPHCYLIGIAEGDQARAADLPYREDDDGKAVGSRHASAAAPTSVSASRGTLQRASVASRRAAVRTPTVHAVQPSLIDATLDEKKPAAASRRSGRLRSTSAVIGSATPSQPARNAARSATNRSDAKATPAPKPKPSTAPVPTSLLAAAPVTATRTSPRSTRSRSAIPVGLTAPTLPLSEGGPESRTKKVQQLDAPRTTALSPSSARKPTRSPNRATKRSA